MLTGTICFDDCDTGSLVDGVNGSDDNETVIDEQEAKQSLESPCHHIKPVPIMPIKHPYPMITNAREQGRPAHK